MSACRVLCWLVGHQYRNSVPRVFECKVYCLRCARVFGHFDAAYAREWWEREGGYAGLKAKQAVTQESA